MGVDEKRKRISISGFEIGKMEKVKDIEKKRMKLGGKVLKKMRGGRKMECIGIG